MFLRFPLLRENEKEVKDDDDEQDGRHRDEHSRRSALPLRRRRHAGQQEEQPWNEYKFFHSPFRITNIPKPEAYSLLDYEDSKQPLREDRNAVYFFVWDSATLSKDQPSTPMM